MTPIILVGLIMLQSPEDAISSAQVDIEAALARYEADMDRRFTELDMDLSSFTEQLESTPEPGDPPGARHR